MVHPTPSRTPLRALLPTARALVSGGSVSLAVIAAIVLAQRAALPLSVIWLGDAGPWAAAGTLFGAALLSFVRARASDRLARSVRLNLLELYLRPFEHGAPALLPSSEAVTARLAVALPVLVSWAVEGVAVVLGAAIAIPIVTLLLASELGLSVLVPLGVAGAVGAVVTMASSPRVEATWTRAFDRSRAMLERLSAGYEGAVDLRAHGRASAFADRLRGDVVAWSAAEGRARTLGAASSWGALVATLAAALGTSALIAPSFAAANATGEMYRAFLLVLAAIPTLQAFVGGISNLLYARDEIEGARRQAAVAAETTLDELDEPIDTTAEMHLERIGYTYPILGSLEAGQAAEGDPRPPALRDISVTLPPRSSLAVVGPNGAGKTTLLFIFLGILRQDYGRILLNGREARLDNRRWHERVAFLSQRPFELKDASIAENLRAFDPGAIDRDLIDALNAVGLWPSLRARAASDDAALDLPYADLSRGEGRRVLLARALLRDADLLVLDEPEAHLDTASVAELARILARLAQGRRVIAAVHDRSLAAFTDRVLELRAPHESPSHEDERR